LLSYTVNNYAAKDVIPDYIEPLSKQLPYAKNAQIHYVLHEGLCFILKYDQRSLAEEICKQLFSNRAYNGKSDKRGKRYIVDMVIESKDQQKTVDLKTTWLLPNHNSKEPELLFISIERVSHKDNKRYFYF